MRTNEPELGADLLVDFLNTLDVEDDVDQLADDEGHRRWAGEHGVEPGDRATTVQARDALRAIVDGEVRPLPPVELPVTAGPGSVGLGARTAADAAVASAVVLSLQGKLGRVKLCGGEDCRWAFYDASRNGSRQWCSMEVCGNRQKARTFRAKPREA
ncbi:CGNR zinc finger domain-containing protein [Leifsonia sp. fls2-241-R2A-40a]|uniref:CGNR zinc finger domain-containing protein n=1 Tax=Leifsonia sp. fls2-241-R2A-40a TaxID=3040290 RepID=UPI00255129F6|nr:CGNR zinc finger domain-containing protein [Leifsonia sp. fls2-241-R2A-40a]